MLLFLGLACSLGVTPWVPCESGRECRDAFGFGQTCGEAGYCVAVDRQARCDSTWPEDLLVRPEEYNGALIVGSLYDHTTDIPERQATRLAVKQADQSQGVDGHTVGLVQCSYEEDQVLDGLTSDEAAVEMANYLADDLGAFAIVGPATSGVTEAVYNGLPTDGPLLVSPSATSPALSYLDEPDRPEGGAGRLWRTAPPDSLQGEVLATLVETRLGNGNQHVALVYQTGPYGDGLAEVFVANWSAANRVADRYPFENDTQRSTAASSAAAPTYDAIIFISSDLPDVTAFLESIAVDEDAAEIPIFLADAARDAELLAQTKNTDAEALWPNVTGTAPAVPSGNQYDAFNSAYSGEYEGESADDSSYSAYAYDAAWLTMYGASWALANEPALNGQNAAEGLRHITDKAADSIEVGPVTWNQVQAAFAVGEDIDARGASGTLDYDPETEETTGPIEVWGIGYDDDDSPTFLVLTTVEP
ncbi:amino acid ABC transporter substrate-binding protein [Deltaproteobacteria bacterium]|nr:amino acid ABC transporter substrate-binding protein [Deltaproteobacteria bacterium]